jgi:hypothetical protein
MNLLKWVFNNPLKAFFCFQREMFIEKTQEKGDRNMDHLKDYWIDELRAMREALFGKGTSLFYPSIQKWKG